MSTSAAGSALVEIVEAGPDFRVHIPNGFALASALVFLCDTRVGRCQTVTPNSAGAHVPTVESGGVIFQDPRCPWGLCVPDFLTHVSWGQKPVRTLGTGPTSRPLTGLSPLHPVFLPLTCPVLSLTFTLTLSAGRWGPQEVTGQTRAWGLNRSWGGGETETHSSSAVTSVRPAAWAGVGNRQAARAGQLLPGVRDLTRPIRLLAQDRCPSRSSGPCGGGP